MHVSHLPSPSTSATCNHYRSFASEGGTGDCSSLRGKEQGGEGLKTKEEKQYLARRKRHLLLGFEFRVCLLYWNAPQILVIPSSASPVNRINFSGKKHGSSSFLPCHRRKGQAQTAVKLKFSEQIFRLTYQIL